MLLYVLWCPVLTVAIPLRVGSQCHNLFINFLQISSSAIRTRLVSSDVQEDSDSDDAEALIIEINEEDPRKRFQELDIRSCLQFLIELFEQWLSPFVIPKTPLMLKTEAVKSVRRIFTSFLLHFLQIYCMYLETKLCLFTMESKISYFLLSVYFATISRCNG